MRVTTLGFLASVLVVAPAAWAESESEAPATAPSAPDVVMLKDGGMVRGTIAEKTAESVAIVTIAGDQRTYAMKDVAYAGPEADRPEPVSPAAPPTQPPPPEPEPPDTEPASPSVSFAPGDEPRPFATVHAGSARVHFTSTPADVSLHVHSGSGHTTAVATKMNTYSNVCTAPCDATLPTGTHRLALSHGKGQPIEPEDPVRLDGDARLEGKYVSKQGYRTAGLLVFAGSLGVGGYLLLTAWEEKEDCSTWTGSCRTTGELNDTKLYGGAAAVMGGTLISMVLVATPDEAEISVAPMSSAGLRGSRVADRSDEVDELVPRGAAFYGRF